MLTQEVNGFGFFIEKEGNDMETMTEKVLKIGKLFRDFTVARGDINTDKRTVALSFSSETEEIERWFGVEILDHSVGACNLRRLKRAGALLIDHDPRNQVGVIEEVTVGADRKGRAVVRFGRSAKAEEIFQDVVDGIRKNVSCGYEVFEMKLERTQENGPDVYRVVKWEPFEISLVSIPADISVGVGRGEGQEEREIRVAIPQKPAERAEEKKPECHSKDDMDPMMKPEDCTMGEDCENARCSAAKKGPRATVPGKERTMKKQCDICGGELAEDGKCGGPKHEEMAAQQRKFQSMSAEEKEKARIQGIRNLAKAYKLDDSYVDMWKAQGTGLDGVAEDILKIMEERTKANPQPASRLGLSAKETEQFSLVRAINACANKDWSKAGYELEVSRAVAEKMNKVNEPMKFFVPFEVLQRGIPGASGGFQRDLTAGTTSAGGYLVETTNVGFIEMLRNRSVCLRMGARELTGLVGNVAIPKQTAGATAYWLTNEATQATEGGLTFAQVSLTPKSVAAYVEISRQLLIQSSPGAEGIVTSDLAKQVALAADLAGLEGSGSPQPTGIASTSGIGSFTGATLSYAYVLDAQVDVADNNVMPMRGGYVTTPAVAAICMQRQRFTSTDTPLWVGNIWDGAMCGFPAMSSKQLTAATMIFGDWAELIMASWGTLEVEVNPYANFQAGIVGVRAMYLMDVGVRLAGAFTRATSIT